MFREGDSLIACGKYICRYLCLDANVPGNSLVYLDEDGPPMLGHSEFQYAPSHAATYGRRFVFTKPLPVDRVVWIDNGSLTHTSLRAALDNNCAPEDLLEILKRTHKETPGWTA